MSLPQQLQYHENIFDALSQNTLFDSLKHDITWKQDHIKLFGKVHPTPRLVAWYGDPHCTYNYSGVVNTPLEWTPTLLTIKDRIEQLLYPAKFNCVLLNFYRDGHDKMGWHSDDEKELGPNPNIASVSFGATRRFDFKHKIDPCNKFSLELHSGSVLLMQGDMQQHWLHQLPAQKRILTPRINLTFRYIHCR
ncbi:MAG: alpha-ketoglutarate-dependent dioxygenase AlkB [Bacteroidetes bacterium]|nr:alpha-ketoglutarate-dependent dioxygenase AlkB [Bacteroidota bacterium]